MSAQELREILAALRDHDVARARMRFTDTDLELHFGAGASAVPANVDPNQLAKELGLDEGLPEDEREAVERSVAEAAKKRLAGGG